MSASCLHELSKTLEATDLEETLITGMRDAKGVIFWGTRKAVYIEADEVRKASSRRAAVKCDDLED